MSAKSVRRTMLELMDALGNGAAALDGMADELVQAAVDLDERPGTEVMLSIARGHRVRALEMRGQLAAMKIAYAGRFHPEL